MAEDNKWKGWWYFITNNWSFTTWLIIGIIIVALFFMYGQHQKNVGIELGTGKLNQLSAMPITSIPDIQKALDLGLNEFTWTVNPETQEGMFLASDKPIKNKNEMNRLKIIGAIDFQGMDLGGAYELTRFASFNLDCPIILTRSAGAGVSKDFTNDFSVGGGMFIPYDVKNFEEVKDKTAIKIYAGWRF